MGRLAILAGGGELPHIGMKEALALGEDPLFFSIIESEFAPGIYPERNRPVHIAQFGKFLKSLKEHKVDRLLMLGKVKKDLLFQNLKFDLKALSILAKTVNRNDYPIFLAVADELEKNGIQVISQKTFLKPLLLPAGRYTASKIPRETLEDIAFGMEYAKKMADLDIGQLVVVQNKSVISVEAVEGTDETIQRGGRYTAKTKKAVVCKSGKRKQDERFDLPTIGLHTLETMVSAQCKTLCIAEGSTLVVNPEAVVSYANKAKLNFMVLGSEGIEKTNAKQKKIIFR